jgi:hypothetical protein
MARVFYVDTAKSITSKERKRYWKCSIVENNQNIANFANGKAKFSIEAEAFTILKTVYWLIEQKYQGKVIIYSDCRTLIDLTISKLKDRLAATQKLKEKGRIKRTIKEIRNSKALPFINLAKILAASNNFDLQIKWIAGKKNPADYYSRLNNGKYHAKKQPTCSAKGKTLKRGPTFCGDKNSTQPKWIG